KNLGTVAMSTHAQRVVDLKNYRAERATEFAQLAKFIMANRGLQNAAFAAENSREGNLGLRLAEIVQRGTVRAGISREVFLNDKATVVAGALTGSPLADYSAISSGFIASLATASAFDAMLTTMVPVPLGTGTLGAVTVGATAYSVAEGSTKPISKLTIASQPM